MNRAGISLLILLIAGVIIRFIILSEAKRGFAEGDVVRFSSRIMDTPEEEKGLSRFRITPQGYEEIRVVTSAYPRYRYGQNINVVGSIKKTTFKDGTIAFTTYFPTIEEVEDTNFLFRSIQRIQTQVEETFSSLLPPTSSSLLLGIVFGVKEGLPKDFEKMLQTTGVFHVIAASGMNVSMLSGFLLAVLGRILRRQVALVLSIVAIGFYAVLAGLEPSIVRASIMAGIAFTALLLGRQGTALWSLILTALVMLVINPLLINDIGFQLSFAATLGIILIKPYFSWEKHSKEERNPTLSVLREDLSSTISAQIATVPILLFYFHQYGLLSIPINALILWTIPPLMIIGSLSALLSFIIPPLAALLVFLALPFLWLFEGVITMLSPFNPVIEVEDLPRSLILGFYLVLGSVLIFMKRRKEAGHSP